MRQAAGGVLALDASRFAQANFRSGARALIDSLDAFSVFRAAVVEDCTYERPECRVEGLDLRTGNLIMRNN